MNKLQGFYELARIGIPTVPWKEFKDGTLLDQSILWTVRTAVMEGDDFHLPRAIGVTCADAFNKYHEFRKKLTVNDLIIYYPFFVAEKSGVIEISKNKIIIETCQEDLWNLVTKGIREATYFIENNGQVVIDGNKSFLTNDEINQLCYYPSFIRTRYKDYISEGKTIALEWSYAYKSDLNKNPIGERYLVFYELRLL